MSKRPGRRVVAASGADSTVPEPFTPAEIASMLRDAFTASCWPAAAGGSLSAHRSGRLRKLASALVDRLGRDVADGFYSWPELVNVLIGAALAIQLLQCNSEGE